MTSPASPFSLLILGGGAVVAEFHLPALAQLQWLDHVRVADPSASALQRLTRAFPNLKTMQLDFHAALEQAARENVNAVLVALPNALHEQAVTRALELGLDVLCEKPLALTRDACARLEQHAARAEKILAVGMVRRFTPAVQALRNALRAGWLGEIQRIEIEDGSAFAWSSDSGSYFRAENAGVLANVGVHTLDLIEYLCGEIFPVAYSDDARGGVEANAQFDLRTANSSPIQISLSYTHRLANKFQIHGVRGVLYLDKQFPDRAFFRACGAEFDAVLTLPKPFANGDWQPTLESAFAEQLCDFQNACVERRAPRATAGEAAHTAALIDWAYAQPKPSSFLHSVQDRLFILPPSSFTGDWTYAQPPARVDLQSTLTDELKAPRLEITPPPRFEKRVVVTGGTGFVGGHLVEALCEHGAREIILPVRSFRNGANVGRFPVKMERVDLLNPTELRAVTQNAQHVFHFAFGRDGENTARVTVEGTKNVVEAAIANGAESVVVLSTTAVFGDPGGARSVDESFPYAPTNEYEKLKMAAEVWTLARAKQETKTRGVVINSACIYGPRGKTFTELPAQLLRENQFAWIEQGRGMVNYVFVKNLCDAILLAATQLNTRGERFIVSDGATTWRDFFTLLFGERAAALASHTRAELETRAMRNAPGMRDLIRALVRNPELWRVVRENPRLARAKQIVGRITPRLYQQVQDSRAPAASTNHTPPLSPPPAWLADLYGVTTTQLSSAKAQRVLGWTPRVSLADGQAVSRAWLQEIGLFDDTLQTFEVGDSENRMKHSKVSAARV